MDPILLGIMFEPDWLLSGMVWEIKCEFPETDSTQHAWCY